MASTADHRESVCRRSWSQGAAAATTTGRGRRMLPQKPRRGRQGSGLRSQGAVAAPANGVKGRGYMMLPQQPRKLQQRRRQQHRQLEVGVQVRVIICCCNNRAGCCSSSRTGRCGSGSQVAATAAAQDAAAAKTTAAREARGRGHS